MSALHTHRPSLLRRIAGLLVAALVASLIPLGIATNAFAADGGNTIETATPYAFGTTINDSITANDSVDFYRFTLAESGRVDLALNA
ncbi:MAG TPA: hypothetical protein PKE40_07445, partial [Arachnia sp.]|nr:hypothetical protein [Arachnia sp.]HMT86169.1 hypothetical protein [Arachnia sp.]